MRTTLRIDELLFRRVKKLAADTHRTLTQVIEDALREMIARRESARRSDRPTLGTFAGRGLQAGVDLDHGAELLDRMEERRAPN